MIFLEIFTDRKVISYRFISVVTDILLYILTDFHLIQLIYEGQRFIKTVWFI